MHVSAKACLVFASVLLAGEAYAQFPAIKLGSSPAPQLTVGRPVPLTPRETPALRPSDHHAVPTAPAVPAVRPQLKRPQPVFRAQGAPPPPLPPASIASGLSGDEAYNCGVVPYEDAGSCWDNCWGRCCDMCRGIPGAFTSIWQPGANRALFQSDHAFDSFISPVSNPFYLEDPRALTEVRPVFIYQRTPTFDGTTTRADIFYVGAQARVALSENISLIVSKLGYIWVDPNDATTDQDGFAEVHVGPKFTFIRNDESNTLLAAGVTFEIPAGSSEVGQATGDLSVRPYLSYGQTFFRDFTYGSFNFINTTGYSFRTDNERSEFVFTSVHVDFNIGNLNRFYPLIEANYFHYTRSGNNSTTMIPSNIEGADMANLGSTNVSGNNELNLSFGGRWKPAGRESFQLGAAVGFNPLGSNLTLKDLVVTTDLIFRY